MKENSIKDRINNVYCFKNSIHSDFRTGLYYKEELENLDYILSDYKRVLKENEELNYKLHLKKIALEIYNRYIPKSKVEDIIEELKINLVNMQGEELLIYESKIDILQELLRESEE